MYNFIDSGDEIPLTMIYILPNYCIISVVFGGAIAPFVRSKPMANSNINFTVNLIFRLYFISFHEDHQLYLPLSSVVSYSKADL